MPPLSNWLARDNAPATEGSGPDLTNHFRNHINQDGLRKVHGAQDIVLVEALALRVEIAVHCAARGCWIAGADSVENGDAVRLKIHRALAPEFHPASRQCFELYLVEQREQEDFERLE